jgi:hypothetical protein
MIDESAAFLPIWMLIAAALGFMVGEACGGLARIRKYLELDNEDLRAQLDKAHTAEEPIRQELKHRRGVLHDVHKQITAVSKALQKRPS